MAVPQVVVVAPAVGVGPHLGGLAIVLLVLAQAALMPRLLADPRTHAPWYNATGTTLYVLGMLASALRRGRNVPGPEMSPWVPRG